MAGRRGKHQTWAFLEEAARLADMNPFDPARAARVYDLLGEPESKKGMGDFLAGESAEKLRALRDKTGEALEDAAKALTRDFKDISEDDRWNYRAAAWFWVYYRHVDTFDACIEAHRPGDRGTPDLHPEWFGAFVRDLGRFIQIGPDGGETGPLIMGRDDAADLFAFCFQLRRAVRALSEEIAGVSPSAQSLRRALWEAIFTRRLLWSYKYLKNRMANFSTLILGGSGTGKDLAARAVGTSQFIPFLPGRNRFAANPETAFTAVNLSAMTPTLIESELFGHAKGSFTGAASERKGLLELCSPHGALFLDEIGDLSKEIQVKLLRVLQSREFTPLGGSRTKRFQGRILSATNRDIPALIREGSMREDFLYRLGAVVIRVPNLEQRFRETPAEFDCLLDNTLKRVLGRGDAEVFDELKARIAPMIEGGYPWPGNVREFEQCVRGMLVSSEHRPLIEPPGKAAGADGLRGLFGAMERGTASADEVMRAYCRHAHRLGGNYRETGARLGLDWRTVKKYAE